MRYLKQFEALRMFREYGPDYRRPIMDKLEDSLVEIFDKWLLSESPGCCRVYSWWREKIRKSIIKYIIGYS